jgi:predicted  nucleic acid-binding Zn-ribbon protein
MGLSRSNGELEILAEKAASEQNRLYAGGMSARDADYVRREVEMLYAKVSKMEDDVLAFIELKEEAESLVDGLTEDLVGATAERDELRDSITEQWRVIDKELAMKEERKRDAVSLVDEYLLEIYDGLRESNEGRVVGKLVDGVCGSCHLKLSAAEEARAVKDDPPRCIHCRSILVT